MSASASQPPIAKVLSDYFPQLKEPELRGIIGSQARWRRFEAGRPLMEPGQAIEFLPLLVEGSIQISRVDREGRELFLYFLHPGETCALTLECCRPGGVGSVRATAEEDGALLALPSRFIRPFLDEYPGFRDFVIETYARRFDALLDALDAVAFNRLDERMLLYLRQLTIARNSRTLQVTHQDIADALASTREVVSRLLKQLERLGKVRLMRNQIEVLDASSRPVA